MEEPQGTDLVGERDCRVDPVELVEIDAPHSEPAQAEFGLLAQVFGAAERYPGFAKVDLPALGSDDHTCPARPGRACDSREMGVHLAVQRAFQHHLGQPSEQPARAGQGHTLGLARYVS